MGYIEKLKILEILIYLFKPSKRLFNLVSLSKFQPKLRAIIERTMSVPLIYNIKLLYNGDKTKIYTAMIKGRECVIKEYSSKRKHEHEIQIYTSMGHFDWIPKLIYHGLYHPLGGPVLILPWLGPDLCELIIINHTAIKTKFWSIAKQLINMVSTIHRLGICHMDIKTENLLWYNERLFMIDWEMWDFADAPLPEHGWGTEYAWPPKPWTYETPRTTDVWQLGVALYVIYTGFHPPYPFQWPRCGSYINQAHIELTTKIQITKYLKRQKIRDFIFWILNPDPQLRPTIDQIQQTLCTMGMYYSYEANEQQFLLNTGLDQHENNDHMEAGSGVVGVN